MSQTARAENAIKAVIFDVDGVLIDSREANLIFYRDFLAGFGYTDLTPERLAPGHYMNLREAIAHMTQAEEERVLEIWEAAKPLPGYPFELLSLPAHCEASLRGLAERYSLSIVTSRHRHGIEHFFQFSGLKTLFDHSIGFEDYANPKPHPEPLLTVCARMNLAPQHCVYVGDAPSDYACAQAAGMPFIAYGDGIPDAPLSVSAFPALADALRELES